MGALPTGGARLVNSDRLRRGERWLAMVRLRAVPFAALQIPLERHYPPN